MSSIIIPLVVFPIIFFIGLFALSMIVAAIKVGWNLGNKIIKYKN